MLFGESTLALRQWMRDNGITFDVTQNEPEDHFGTLLMLAAWLRENGRDDECDQLLAWHLLPWSQRFLAVFAENARHPFYVGIAELAQMTLADWQSHLPIPVVEKPFIVKPFPVCTAECSAVRPLICYGVTYRL